MLVTDVWACGQSHPGHSHANSLNTPLEGTRATPQLLPLTNSPLNQSLWLSELESDADSEFLSDGMLFGFKLTGADTNV